MFYIKYAKEKIFIEDDNIFNSCPACGHECRVDLQEVLSTGGDLYATQVYCPKCSEERAKRS